MSVGRNMMRDEIKRIYKERCKGVPRRQRMPFSEFYKQYKAAIASQTVEEPHDHEHDHEDKDFNFDDMVNRNEISDATVEEKKA